MKVTYTASDGTVTITGIAGCRTDGYRTYDMSYKTIVATVGGVSKTITLNNYWQFGASSTYQDFGFPTTTWTGVSASSVAISFSNPSSNSNANLANAKFSGSITMTYTNRTLTLIGDEGVQSVTGAGTYSHGATATVSVTCKPGYVLKSYYGTTADGSSTSTWTSAAGKKSDTDTWTMNASRTIYIYTTFQGCYVYASGAWKKAVPYVYTSGAWKEAVPYVYKDGAWKIGTG